MFLPILATSSSQLICFLWSSFGSQSQAGAQQDVSACDQAHRTSFGLWKWFSTINKFLLLKAVSEDEVLDVEATDVPVVLLVDRPPHNDPASACFRSWRSSGSRGRCRRPGRGGRGGDRTTGSGSEGLAALYTPENTTECLKTENRQVVS